jgi:hypothetical protein
MAAGQRGQKQNQQNSSQGALLDQQPSVRSNSFRRCRRGGSKPRLRLGKIKHRLKRSPPSGLTSACSKKEGRLPGGGTALLLQGSSGLGRLSQNVAPLRAQEHPCCAET